MVARFVPNPTPTPRRAAFPEAGAVHASFRRPVAAPAPGTAIAAGRCRRT